MIKRSDLLALNFYKSSPFTGSMNGLRYRVERITPKPAENADASEAQDLEPYLLASAWHGPFAYDHTPAEEITTFTAPFSEEGLVKVVDWLNEQV